MNNLTSLPSFGLDPAREVPQLGQQGAASLVLEACHETLAALEQYSAILLDDRDISCSSAEERAALVDLEARIKIPSPPSVPELPGHSCQDRGLSRVGRVVSAA